MIYIEDEYYHINIKDNVKKSIEQILKISGMYYNMDDIEIEMHEKFKGIIKIEDFEFDVGYATKFYGCQKYKIIHPLCINTRKFIEHGILDKHTPTINELYEYNRLNSVKLNEYCQYYIKKYKEYFNNL